MFPTFEPDENVPTTASAPSSTLLRGGAIAVLARLVGVALSLAISVVTARALGPAGKGTFAFLSAAVALVVRAGSLGLDGSFTQFYLARRRPLAVCLGTLLWITVGAGVAASLVGQVAIVAIPGMMQAAPRSLSVPLFLAMPAFFVLYISTFVLFGLKRETFFAVLDIGYRVALLSAFLIAFYVFDGALTAAVWIHISAGVCFAAAATVAMGRAVHWRFPFDLQLAREMLAYGVRYYSYGLLRYALCYQGVLIAGLMLTNMEAGLFSVAAAFTEVIMLFAGSVNLAFYPAVATAADPHRYTATATRRVLGLSCLVGIGMAIAARPVVRTLYGTAFLPSVPVFLCMLPGWILLCGEQMMSSFFALKGMPWRVVSVFFVGTLLAAALSSVLSRQYGINGVGVAMGLSAALVSAAVAIQFVRAA